MRVRELIDILSDQDPDAEVELSIVAPTDEDSDDVEVDRHRPGLDPGEVEHVVDDRQDVLRRESDAVECVVALVGRQVECLQVLGEAGDGL